MMRFLVFLGFIWVAWRILKSIFRIMSHSEHLKQKREGGAVEGDASSTPRVEFKDVQDAEFTEIKPSEPASKPSR